jgi:hypothetical protein
MDRNSLAAVDRLISTLSPGKQEMVREVVVDAVRRGALPAANRRALDRLSGSGIVGEVLTAALAERPAQRVPGELSP